MQYTLSIIVLHLFDVDLMAMATSAIHEYQKHCNVVLHDCKRKLDYSYYGGKTSTMAAANYFLGTGKKLMVDFEMFSGHPQERKKWICEQFGADAFKPGKSLACQKTLLACKLVNHDVHWFEAGMMQAAIRAVPGLTKKDEYSLSYDEEAQRFSAHLGDSKQGITQHFAKIVDAKTWLLNMGKSSEAGAFLKKYV